MRTTDTHTTECATSVATGRIYTEQVAWVSRVHTSNDISIGPSVSEGLAVAINAQTMERTTPATIGGIEQVLLRTVHALGVVEEPAVPEVVEAASVVVEEAAIGAVELVQSVDGVLAGVTVHHVQQHGDAAPMCLVDQLLQLVRRPVPTTQYRQSVSHGGSKNKLLI